MRVIALISFVGYDADRTKRRVSQGDEFEMPAGVDWLEKGLVEAVSPQPSPRPSPSGRGGKKSQEQEKLL